MWLPHRIRRGFSMVELIVVMAVIALLLALSVPAMGRAREAAKKVECLNHLRNIAFGLTQYDHFNGRLPASGSYSHDANLNPHQLHSWAVMILPYVDQGNLYQQLDLARPASHSSNKVLATAYVPVYVCPVDLSRNKDKERDLSYAVNGGVGFTVNRNGVRDCPVDRNWTVLDLNGDGRGCTGDEKSDDQDRVLFDHLGLFFLETMNTDITRRSHSLANVQDGTSQTFLVTENVRAGYDPAHAGAGFADSNPYRCAFYIGNPCRNGHCREGEVDYSLSNSGNNRINSGLWSAEGSSPIPNSFHPGGVNMAYADGHVSFLSEQTDGAVYAALSSPQGGAFEGTPLKQALVAGGGF
ncbi:MAG TPA: DUF1559 domain-containing protein [Planctomicrobium sp.]|nr:DUF1559 domain-containing protein [Planctomicrobium sp.]